MPPSRPKVIAATNSAKPDTPTQWRASYPSTRASASQSFAAPSTSVKESTMTPIASVRGSSQALPGDAVGSSSSAGRNARVPFEQHDGGQEAQQPEVDRLRDREGGHGNAERGAGDRRPVTRRRGSAA